MKEQVIVTSSEIAALKRIAVRRYGTAIVPPSGMSSFESCVTVVGDKIVFWFNSPDNSTRVACIRTKIRSAIKNVLGSKITDAAGNQWYYDRNGRYIMCRRHDDKRNCVQVAAELIKRSILG